MMFKKKKSVMAINSSVDEFVSCKILLARDSYVKLQVLAGKLGTSVELVIPALLDQIIEKNPLLVKAEVPSDD